MVISAEPIENGKIRIICFKDDAIKTNVGHSDRFFDCPDEHIGTIVELAECGKIDNAKGIQDFLNDLATTE